MAKKNRLRIKARQDVRLANRPSLRAIRRETRRGTQDFNNLYSASDNAYYGLLNELQGLNPQYNQVSNNIAESLNAQLGGLAGLLGTANPSNAPEGSPEAGVQYGTPAGEAAAAAGLYGQLGAGGLELLGSQRQRNLGYTTSAKRQGAIERETAQNNLTQDYRDFLQEMRDRRLDITGAMPAQIQSRLDYLRQQALQNQQIKAQMESDAAFAEFLMSQIGSLLNSQNKPRNKNNNKPPKKTPPKEGVGSSTERRKYGAADTAYATGTGSPPSLNQLATTGTTSPWYTNQTPWNTTGNMLASGVTGLGSWNFGTGGGGTAPALPPGIYQPYPGTYLLTMPYEQLPPESKAFYDNWVQMVNGGR